MLVSRNKALNKRSRNAEDKEAIAGNDKPSERMGHTNIRQSSALRLLNKELTSSSTRWVDCVYKLASGVSVEFVHVGNVLILSILAFWCPFLLLGR